MIHIKDVLKYWKRVFGNGKYLLLGIVVAFSFYSLNVFIANYKSLIDFYPSLGFLESVKLFLSLMVGFKNLILMSSFVSLIIISLLIGMLFSLIWYKSIRVGNYERGKTGWIGGLAIFLGSFAPGCTTCGIGLAAALGLSAAIFNFLPLKGLEFSFLSIVILGYAIFKISHDSCKIMVKKMKGGLQ